MEAADERAAASSCRRTWRSRRPIPSGSTPPSPASTSPAPAAIAARPGSTAATMRARRGPGSRPTRGPPAGSAAATCRCRSCIRRIPTSSSWRAPCRGSRPTAARRGRSFKGAPGGDDYQNGWINPDNPDIILLAADQGAVVTLNGGDTWSSWYNQPTGAVLPRRRRTTRFRIASAAGSRRADRSASSSRGNYGAISDRDWHPGRRRRVRLRRPRSARPRHRLRRPHGDAVRSADRAGVGRRPGRRTRRRRAVATGHRSAGAHDAGHLLRGRQARAVLREQPPLEDDRRRRALEADQPGPDAADVDGAGERRQVRERSVGAARAARRHLHRRAVVSGHQPHLGRDRRRADPRDGRRRRHLEGRHAAGRRTVGEGLDHGRRPLRAADGVRGDQHAAPRRSAPAHLPHARRRQDVDGDRQRHSGRRDGQRRARGSAGGRACSSPAPSAPSTSRSTTATTGSRCG